MNTTRKCLLLLTTALVIGGAAQAAPPTGYWSVNVNGLETVLSLSVDAAGNVTGNLGDSPIKGFWTESAARLVFYRATGPYFDQIQIYEGYIRPWTTGHQCIMGSYQAFNGTGATASKNVFGWWAVTG
jgi:hypothetical protein